MRTVPRLWFGLLVVGIGLFVGWAVWARTRQGPEALPVWLAIGALGGLVAGIVIARRSSKNDARAVRLRRMFPAAVVVQAQKGSISPAARRQLAPWLTGSASRITDFSIVIEPSGLSFWTGSTVPTRVLHIPTNELTTFSVVSETLKTRYGKTADHLLAIGATRGEATAGITFRIEREGSWLQAQGFLGQAELYELHSRVVLMITGKSTGSSPAFTTIGSLEPGLTAWQLREWTKPLAIVALVTLLPGAMLLSAKVMPDLTQTAFLWGLVLLQLPLVVLVVLFNRATKREKAAGYTTLNRVNLDVEQRHPKTGVVIRNSSGQPLTEEKFRELIKQY